jgi:hypothetical protein
MDRLLVGGQLQSMKLALTLTAAEAETEEVVETDGAEGVINKKPRLGKLEEKQWTSQVC